MDTNSTVHHEELDYKQFPNYIGAAIPFFIISMILELCVSLYTKKKVQSILNILYFYFHLIILSFLYINFPYFHLINFNKSFIGSMMQ